MEIIGIICEYNPFHNGHAYHIKTIKEVYPNSLIVLVLNGYFLQRGEVSIINKEDKVKIALEENVDIILEHPFVYASNSADIFAESAITMLEHLKCTKVIFGSESNDLELLTNIAKTQLSEDFNVKLKEKLKTGVNYPTAVNQATNINISSPNDLLGISYIKAILKNNYKIKAETIKRTNDFHDNQSNKKIVSASNIREKIKDNIDINKYTNYSKYIKEINNDTLFNLIKYKILTDHDLSKYLTVDEGIEYRLLKYVTDSTNIEDFINKVKTKRYTYNRIRRMLIHILIGLTKEDKNKTKIEYIKVLGLNKVGQNYINKIKKGIEIPIQRKISNDYLTQKYELKASLIYDILTNDNCYNYEIANKPIIK